MFIRDNSVLIAEMVCLLSEDPLNSESLIALTAYLTSVKQPPVSSDSLNLVMVLLFKAAIGWLSQFRECLNRGTGGVAFRAALISDVNETAVQTICLLRQIVPELPSPNGNLTQHRENLLKHLDVILKAASNRPSRWIDYYNKLFSYSSSVCQLLPFGGIDIVSTISEGTSTGDGTSFVPEQIPLHRIRQAVYGEISKSDSNISTDVSTNGFWWNRAFELSGVLDLIRSVQADSQKTDKSKQPSESPSNADSHAHSLTLQMKSQLMKLQSLHSLWTLADQIEHRMGGDPSPTEDDSMSTDGCSAARRTSTRKSCLSSCSSETRMGKRLVGFDQFTRFVGSPSTPPPSPSPIATKNAKFVVKLKNAESDKKRLPWPIEESVVLWHCVYHSPGVPNWSRIWKQSFRHSGRSPTDLKDRWRVITRNVVIRDSVSSAYKQWKSEQLQCSSEPNNSSLPLPVIIRSPKM